MFFLKRTGFPVISGIIFFWVLFFTLVGFEFYFRRAYPGLDVVSGGNLVSQHFSNIYDYDKTLGWIPKPNHSGTKWNVPITTGEFGIRLNANHLTRETSPLRILAIGDSFTFGDEVGDRDTWTSVLERKLTEISDFQKARVINAGVSSFGLDQMLLRASSLAPIFKPDILILSLLADDFARCFQSVRHGVSKPYFVLESDKVVLRNIPVPNPIQPSGFRQWLLRHSAIVKYLAQFTRLQEFLTRGTMLETKNIPTRGDNAVSDSQVVLAIAQSFAELQSKYHFKLLVIFQPINNGGALDTNMLTLKNYFLSQNSSQVEVLDLAEQYDRLSSRPNHDHSIYFNENWNYHLSPAGNEWVANQTITAVAQILNQQKSNEFTN